MNQNETATRGGNGPAQSIPPLPPGWSLDRGTLSHGAMATHVGHLGSVVRERVAVELERCGFAAFASAWRGLPAAPSAIPGVLVVVQRPDGSVVSRECYADSSMTDELRKAADRAGFKVTEIPLSLALAAPALRDSLRFIADRAARGGKAALSDIAAQAASVLS